LYQKLGLSGFIGKSEDLPKVSDSTAEAFGHIRVIDESGEDYLYPADCFVDAILAEDAKAAVVKAE